MLLTCDDIAKKPCQVVVEDPVEEGEQAANVALEGAEGRREFGEPLGRSRLMLNVCVDRRY